MNFSESKDIVEASLARPSSTPNTSSLSRDEFIEAEKAALRSKLIEPLDVVAHPGAWAIEHCGFEDREYPMVALAKEGTTWLLYEPASETFYRAWSTEGQKLELFLLGFYSNDALAEWRG
jgi:hypothetical protein